MQERGKPDSIPGEAGNALHGGGRKRRTVWRSSVKWRAGDLRGEKQEEDWERGWSERR